MSNFDFTDVPFSALKGVVSSRVINGLQVETAGYKFKTVGDIVAVIDAGDEKRLTAMANVSVAGVKTIKDWINRVREAGSLEAPVSDVKEEIIEEEIKTVVSVKRTTITMSESEIGNILRRTIETKIGRKINKGASIGLLEHDADPSMFDIAIIEKVAEAA